MREGAGRPRRRREDVFGINMEQYCRDHERWLEEHRAAGDDPAVLLAWYEKKLAWVQHERLVHLIVTMMSIVVELGVVLLVLLAPETAPWSAVFMLGWMVLVLAYLRHYFVLENTVQHWYVLAEELHEEAASRGQRGEEDAARGKRGTDASRDAAKGVARKIGPPVDDPLDEDDGSR